MFVFILFFVDCELVTNCAFQEAPGMPSLPDLMG